MQEKMEKLPKRLEITDFPRDEYNVLGGLRGLLQKSYNYCRRFPKKMEFLKSVLEFLLEQINEAEAVYKAQENKTGNKTEEKATKTTTKTKPKATTNKETK